MLCHYVFYILYGIQVISLKATENMKLCNILDTLGKCYSNIAFASLNNFSGVFLNCAIFQILNWICQFQRPNYSASMNIWLTLTKTYLFAVSPSFWANSCLFQAGMACILLSSSSLALSSNASCLALSAAFLANISLFHFGISLPRGSTAGIYKKYLSNKTILLIIQIIQIPFSGNFLL